MKSYSVLFADQKARAVPIGDHRQRKGPDWRCRAGSQQLKEKDDHDKIDSDELIVKERVSYGQRDKKS